MADALHPDASADQLDTPFDHSRVTTLRHEVATLAAGAGLVDERLADFVMAVNEITTNAVKHGGGQGRLRLWSTTQAVHCEVSDHGPGVPDTVDDRRLPPAFAPGGRGLWLVHKLCDAVAVDTGPDGTTVEIRKGIAPRPDTAILGGPDPAERRPPVGDGAGWP